MPRLLRISMSVLAVAVLLTAAQPTAKAQAQEIAVGAVLAAGGLLAFLCYQEIWICHRGGGGGLGDTRPMSPS